LSYIRRGRPGRGPSRYGVPSSIVYALLLVAAGCDRVPDGRRTPAPSGPSISGATRVPAGYFDMMPEWLSPDGRFLFIGVVGQPRAIDVCERREVWRPPLDAQGTWSAAWSPDSGRLAWVPGTVGGGPGVIVVAVPGGTPRNVWAELGTTVPAGGLPLAVCFGPGPRDLVVGVFGGGLPEHQWTAYLGLSIPDGAGPVRLANRALVGAAQRIPPHVPRQMLPIEGGRSTLVVGTHWTGEHLPNALYAIDPARGTVASVPRPDVSEATPSRPNDNREGTASWMGTLSPLDWGHSYLFGVESGGRGRYLFRVDGAQTRRIRRDAVPLHFPPLAALDDGSLFALSELVPGSPEPTAVTPLCRSRITVLDSRTGALRPLTDGSADDDSPIWSRAAHRVLFRRNHTEVWSVSPGGGDLARVWP